MSNLHTHTRQRLVERRNDTHCVQVWSLVRGRGALGLAAASAKLMPFVDGVYVMPSTDMLTEWKDETSGECFDPLCDECVNPKRKRRKAPSGGAPSAPTPGDDSTTSSQLAESAGEYLCQSERFEFYAPTELREAKVLALYNDTETMLPWLPQLCPMTHEQMRVRRESQTAGLRNGTSCCFDVLCRETGQLVGTSGFRSIADGSAEWGVVVHRSWQRQGVCAEAFVANETYARDVLGCHTVTASTTEANKPMRAFFEKQLALEVARKKVDEGVEWLVYEKPCVAAP